ncbi:MAG: MerR family transcriptional regulator [Bacteroidales bacterium]|jgi:DNA-binding transcriptional MerR regulator|nr:MerR family transcriptional regulator [Bacteroidales bacterium]
MNYEEPDIKKIYFTIGETARMLDVPVSTVRFWDNEFKILKPMKNKKGNRLFTQQDIKNLKIIHRLLKEERLTLDGAKKRLLGKWDETNYKFEITESLQKIKSILVEIRDNI